MKKKQLISKEKCSGCYACVNVCPNNCIKMKYDNEGFWYPSINAANCVNCNLCSKACPNNTVPKLPSYKKSSYAAYCLDDCIREESSSGGVFGVLAQYVINMKGCVFGAAFNDDLQVEHVCISEKDELYKLFMSKYVQSKVGLSFKLVKDKLETGTLVLFSGTPCQIAGLRCYLREGYNNLITQEVACHGVPSPMLWGKNLKYISKLHNKSVKNVFFRKKTKCWKNFCIEYVFADGSIHSCIHKDDLFFKAFLNDYSLRISCYNCKYKNQNSVADITLADFWGIESINPIIDDKNGVSLILCNTEKGERIIREISSDLYCTSVDYKQAVSSNSAINNSVLMPELRTIFFMYLRCFSYKKTLSLFCDYEERNKLQFISDYYLNKREKGTVMAKLWAIKNIKKLRG